MMKKLFFLFLLLACVSPALLAQKLQIVHASANADVATVDVWVNGEKTRSDFFYPSATEFLDFEGVSTFLVEIKPSGSSAATEPIAAETFSGVDPSAVLHLVVAGELGSTEKPLRIHSVPGTPQAGSDRINATAFHAATDAPTVNVFLKDVSQLFGPLSYGDDSDVAELPASPDYKLVLTLDDAEKTKIATWNFPAINYRGKGVLVLASGYANPAAAGSQSPFTLSVVLPDGVVEPLEFPVAGMQAIHNAADPALASVSVNIRPTALPDLNLLPFTLPVPFRSATPLLPVLPAEMPLSVDVYNADATALLTTFDLGEFVENESYIAIINGVAETAGFAANPSGRNIEAKIYQRTPYRDRADNANMVELLAFHGTTDAPAIDLVTSEDVTFVSGLTYGDFSPNYISSDAVRHVIEVKAAGTDDVVDAFVADLSSLRGSAGVVFASGFLSPSNNQNGPAFGLFLALTNGNVYELPRAEESGAFLQIINNSADPAASSVSWQLLNGLGEVVESDDALGFRQATPFITVPPNQLMTLVVTVGETPITVFEDRMFELSEAVLVDLNGIFLNPGNYASNPDGEDIVFTHTTRSGEGILRSSGDPQRVALRFYNGVTDAPTLFFRNLISGSIMVEALKYGESEGYSILAPLQYTFIVGETGSSGGKGYVANLRDFGGQVVTIMASGFMDPEANNGGAAFGLYAVLEDGTVIPLPLDPSARARSQSGLPQFTAFPNPTRGELELNWSQSQSAAAEFELLDLTGKSAFRQSLGVVEAGEASRRVDLSSLPQGAYLYRVVSNGYSAAGKVILVD